MDNLVGKISAATQTLTGNVKESTTTLTGKIGVSSGSLTQRYQAKTVIPTQEEQTIRADDSYDALSSVVVAPIPENYGQIIYNGQYLLVK